MERDINLEILLMGLLGWCTGDWNWTGGVRYPPPLLPLLAGDPGLLLGVFGFPTTPMVTPMGVCQEDEDISLSGLLSKLLRTRQMPMLPSLEPVKTWLLLVVIVLMVELWAFISPSKAQVSTDHSLMKPDLQLNNNSEISNQSKIVIWNVKLGLCRSLNGLEGVDNYLKGIIRVWSGLKGPGRIWRNLEGFGGFWIGLDGSWCV